MANTSGNKESQRNGHANQCFVCKKWCNNTCSRCGEFYCSKQCQIDNWGEHKYYCFEMPELIMKSSPSNGQQSNNSSKFQGDNRRMVETLRRSENRPVRDHLNSSENGSEGAGSERAQGAVKRDVVSVGTPKSAAFTFANYPKYNDDVVLTHVRHANSFYIRTCCSDDAYKRNAKDFDDYGRRAKKLPSLPQKNDVVLVRHDGKFHRALIVKVESEDKIDVGLADVGRKVQKTVHEMREISDELKSRPRYNFIVTLDHIPNRSNPDEFKRLLDFRTNRTVFTVQFDGNDWESAKNFKLLGKDSGLPIEKLVSKDEPKQFNGNDSKADENGKVVEMDDGLPMETPTVECEPINGTATEKSTSSTRNVEEPIPNSPNAAEVVNKSHQPISFADLATENLPEVAKLVVIDNNSLHKGYVIAVTPENIPKLDDLYNKVNYCGDAIHGAYEPEHEELCLVKFAGEWYRAISFDTKFLLIDWGTLESIDSRDIRRFPEELKYPCYTFVCNIEGVTDELAGDTEKMEQLKELLAIQSDHPDCACVKVEDEPMEYNVKFPKLSNLFD